MSKKTVEIYNDAEMDIRGTELEYFMNQNEPYQQLNSNLIYNFQANDDDQLESTINPQLIHYTFHNNW